MEFKNILVAFDSSGFSNRAFKTALEIAEPYSSKITIVTVVTGIYQPSVGFSMKFNKELLEKHTKILKKIFAKLQNKIGYSGFLFAILKLFFVAPLVAD